MVLFTESSHEINTQCTVKVVQSKLEQPRYRAVYTSDNRKVSVWDVINLTEGFEFMPEH